MKVDISKSSVFGSWKIDLGVFLFPALLALVMAGGMISFGPKYPPAWYYLILVVAFDTPHFFAGYWVMMRDGGPNRLRLKLVACLAATCGGFLYLFYAGFENFAMTFFALFSLWHFVRQHQAWFFLALRGTANSGRVTYWVNQFGIGAVTWGFFLIGQCSEEREGWFMMNDLFLLPEFLRLPLTVLTVSAILFYLVHHWQLSKRHKTFALSAHLVWLSAVIVWGGARLFDIPYLYSPLIILPHAFAYMFLLQRYERHSVGQRAIRSPLVWLFVAYVAGAVFQGHRFWPLFFDQPMMVPLWVTALVFAISVSHYIHDMIFWRGDENPDWQKRLKL